MVYTLLQDSVSSERLIQQVYKLVDAQSRVRIKWDCLKEDENDLIVVIRSINSSFQLSSIVGNSNLPKDTDVFVYSRRETDGHIECERKKGAYSYFIYPGKLLEKGKNWVTKNTKGVFQSVNAVGLINIAGTNKETAQMVYAVLKSDERLMNEMRKSMGEKGFKKWEKDMKSLTKRISIKRMKMKVTNQYFDDYVSAYAGAYQSLFHLKDGVNVKDGTQTDILNYIRLNQNSEGLVNVVKGAVDLGVTAGKGVAKGAGDKIKDNAYRATHGGEHRIPRKTSKLGIIRQGFKKPSFEPVSGSGFRK